MFAHDVNLSKIVSHGSQMEPGLKNIAGDAAVPSRTVE